MIRKVLTFAALVSFSAPIFFSTQLSAAGETFSADQKQAVEKIIRDYLIKNPAVVRDALISLEHQQLAAKQKARKGAIAKHSDLLFRSKLDYVAGNPKGDVTVVEFLDYNCGYCRRAIPHVLKLIETDKKVRVIFKEFPIFGDDSIAAAKAALASHKQGKYLEMHRALLLEPGRANEAKAMRIAKKLGLDAKKLKADMNDESFEKTIKGVQQLGAALGVEGTPLFLIGDKVIPGAPEDLYDQLVANVKHIRKKGCTIASC